MCFSSTNSARSKGMFSRRATMAMVVTMHDPSDAASRSVGEYELPSPMLSRGAEVVSGWPLGPCRNSIFSPPV
jgi:hypothetical protein